jgi:hypothetical protein
VAPAAAFVADNHRPRYPDVVRRSSRRVGNGSAPHLRRSHRREPERSRVGPARRALSTLLARLSYLACSGSNPVPRGRQFDQFPHGRTGFVIYYQIPMLVAAIDPAEESKLVGLDGAVVRGRYLEESDRTQVVRPDGRHGPALRQVPVLMAKRPLTDDRLEVRLDKLALGPAARVPGHLASAHAEDWLASRRRTSLDTVELDDRRVYRLLLRLYRREIPNSKVDYWSPGPARVHSGGQASTIDVKARPPLPAETFRSFYFGGYLAPQVSADRSFRGLLPHESSTLLDGSVPVFPVLHQVGVFDAKLLEGFSALSEVPLTNYYPPDAAPVVRPSRQDVVRGRSAADGRAGRGRGCTARRGSDDPVPGGAGHAVAVTRRPGRWCRRPCRPVRCGDSGAETGSDRAGERGRHG